MNLEHLNETISCNEVATALEVPDCLRVNEAENFAPSIEVQATEICEAFRDMPELSFENWQGLSVEERTEALNAFESKIAEIELRDAMPVKTERLDDNVYGYYDGAKLVVSDKLLGSNRYEDYKEVMDTLLHEGRHAYQFHNVDVCQTERSDMLVDAWRVNLKELGYCNASRFAINGFQRYYTQPVEVDARHFAETVINKIGL